MGKTDGKGVSSKTLDIQIAQENTTSRMRFWILLFGSVNHVTLATRGLFGQQGSAVPLGGLMPQAPLTLRFSLAKLTENCLETGSVINHSSEPCPSQYPQTRRTLYAKRGLLVPFSPTSTKPDLSSWYFRSLIEARFDRTVKKIQILIPSRFVSALCYNTHTTTHRNFPSIIPTKSLFNRSKKQAGGIVRPANPCDHLLRLARNVCSLSFFHRKSFLAI